MVLTQGTRPVELRRGLDSLLRQTGVRLDIVVVGNGWQPVDLPDRVLPLALPENVGIPAGRNAGVGHVAGDLLFFLDDDAWLLDDDFLAQCAARFAADRTIGMIQPRIEDPAAHELPTRWIPRLRKGSPYHSSNVFSVVEMAVAIRREVFERTLGWPASFFYAHEGIELAWRVWGAGSRVVYDGSLRAGHPVIDPRRHDDYYLKNARNRVWLARRNLPWPVSWAYVGTWTAVQVARSRRAPQTLRPWFAGWREGWTEQPWAPGEQHGKLPWSAVWRMGRGGRWPVV
ncbi:glycosyltransferase family 2 protein [Flexivirga caeni]|uniref:glycosyltransferase family 2 protein n=1 Tax=Flexivirga caeni TaxID=2294115 RepID=UPI001FEB065F|nr:glycosyltransferase [Flexivirga caeni]